MIYKRRCRMSWNIGDRRHKCSLQNGGIELKTVGLIMAGGSGTRFWPISRKRYPKQALKLIGEKEMINLTIDRCDPLIGGVDMHIITNEEQKDLLADIVGQRLPEGNIFAEPSARNTAPCILYSVLKLQKRYGDVVVCVLSADHYIKDEAEFRRQLQYAANYAAQNDVIVTLGIVPTFPSTGYGYIKKGMQLEYDVEIHQVERFVEKPDIETANSYLADGGYLWNSGMFVFRISTILDSYRKYMPEMCKAISPLEEVLDTDKEKRALAEIYPKLEKISFDYAIMEHETRVVVIPGDFGWSDVGTWDALEDVLPPDDNGNVVHGQHIGIDTRDCVIYGDGKQLIATIGLSDVVIVSSGDALLVCPRERVQDIRSLVDKIEKENGEKFL